MLLLRLLQSEYTSNQASLSVLCVWGLGGKRAMMSGNREGKGRIRQRRCLLDCHNVVVVQGLCRCVHVEGRGVACAIEKRRKV